MYMYNLKHIVDMLEMEHTFPSVQLSALWNVLDIASHVVAMTFACWRSIPTKLECLIKTRKRSYHCIDVEGKI